MLTLPEVSICRSDGAAFLTVNAVVRPGEDAGRRAAALEARLAGLRAEPLPMLDPHPTSQAEIRSARPPGDFEAMVGAATERIEAGEMRKVVLAREVVVGSPAAHDPVGPLRRHARAVLLLLLLLLRHARGRLLRRQPRAAGAALRGERLDRGPGRLDPAQLRPRRRRPPRRAAPAQRQEPPRAANRLRAHRPHPAPARGLGRGRRRARGDQGRQHPAPGHAGDRPARRTALGGRARRPHAPDPGRRRRAPRRGRSPRSPSSSRWTAAGTPARSAGWTRPKTASSASRLRSALLRDREAHLYAGVGVVAGSDPAAELDETEIKLQALLPLLT